MADNDELKSYFNVAMRGLIFTFGVFLLALTYNMFLLPNDIVLGGMSGLAIVFNKVTGMDPQTFIYLSSGILLLISFIFLGWKKTKNTIIVFKYNYWSNESEKQNLDEICNLLK